MKIPSIYRLYWMLLLLIPVLTVSAKNNKENALQQGKLTLANGTVLNGWLSIRISHGEDEVLYKKERTGTKIYSYPVSELSDFSIGHSHYKVQYIPLPGRQISTGHTGIHHKRRRQTLQSQLLSGICLRQK